MKKLAYYFSAALLSATVLFTSCKKDSEPTPDPAPDAKVFTSTMTANNMGNTDAANIVGSVNTSDGLVKLRLDVNGNNKMDQIFVMVSKDNGFFEPVIFQTQVNALGQSFQGGNSNYSLKVPNLKNFVIDLPLNVRTIGSTDAYQIWITNGDGSFTKPTKNRDLGIATVLFKYSASVPTAFTIIEGTVGDQLAVEPSFIVTTGQGGTMLQTDYKNDLNPENALSVDISFASLNITDDGLGAIPNLVSPSVREAVGFSASNEPDPANTNVTHFGAWSGTDYYDATGADLESIGTLTNTTIDIADNGTYAFVTETGKKGLIKVIGSIGTSGASGKKFYFQIKVLN